MAYERCKLSLYHTHSCTGGLNQLQIAYVAIVGSVMMAALLEWFLWVAAFLYCLVKVYQKAENWSIKILAILITVVFTALR